MMTGGNSLISLVITTVIMLGLTGVWLGTTGVWLWVHGTEYGLMKGAGIAIVIVLV
jgi:palmitoyltransferase ZDHHC9/14/18